MSENRERPPQPGRACIFCDTPFSPRMTAWFGPERPCACCDGQIRGHWPIAMPEKVEVPTEDLACDHCGKVLYLAVKP